MGRARSIAKSCLAATFHHSRLLPLLARVRRQLVGPRVHIVAIHRVVDDLDRLPDGVMRSLCIRTSTFERLCRLAAQRFDVLPLDEAAAVLAGRRATRRDVLVLTFDDGYRDVLLRALPILQRHRLPATVFVPTELTRAQRLLDHDRLHALLGRARRSPARVSRLLGPRLQPLLAPVESTLERRGPSDALTRLIERHPRSALARLADGLEAHFGPVVLDAGAAVMSPAELRRLVEGGVSLGAHTADHAVLTHERGDDLRRQLEEPRRVLEEISGQPCRAFAYCNGRWDLIVVNAVRAAGYHVAVTTHDAPNSLGQQPLLLRRKTLCEGYATGPVALREALLASHLHDLFGDLGLTHPVDGRVRSLSHLTQEAR